ncbi:MAG: hypothetical protein IJB48_01005 [Clostridia bacterium]|nr:hypothetical protein [Clostridia bacterium]
MSRIVLGLGTGQCGLKLLADILNAQQDCAISYEDPRSLPWKHNPAHLVGCENFIPSIKECFVRWNNTRSESILGDVASFYLPYVEEAMSAEENIRIVCLQRSKEEVVAAFERSIYLSSPRPIDNWSENLEAGWYRHPTRFRFYPKYQVSSRREALELYWEEYTAKAQEYAEKYPEKFCIFDPSKMESESGVREILDFVGIPKELQKPVTGNRSPSNTVVPPDSEVVRSWQQQLQQRPPSHCVILVPFLGYIHQECDASLKELERRGYQVRRIGGYSAIDQGRNQMATDALIDGFEETLWIDSDIAFHPDDVEKLRARNLPIVAALYPQKGRRALASHVIPGTKKMTFGKEGGITEILYAGTGFLLVRREVYLKMLEDLHLPYCNERFEKPTIPFFQPLIRSIENGTWYLAEDYAFGHRARACGYKIWADTTIRLGHIGNYRYSWEDAGMERRRFATFTLNFASSESHGNAMSNFDTSSNSCNGDNRDVEPIENMEKCAE